MKQKRLAKRVAFVAAAVASAGAFLVQPASAAQVDAYFHGTHAAVDNNPGDGAAGWVWVYGSTESGTIGGSIQYQYWDGSIHELTVGRGATASRDTSSGIKGFRACTNNYIDGYDFQACGGWTYFG